MKEHAELRLDPTEVRDITSTPSWRVDELNAIRSELEVGGLCLPIHSTNQPTPRDD